MDLLLLHFILLVWLSVGAASRWCEHPADIFLAAAALGWANLLATAMLLSPSALAGHPPALLGVSVGLAGLVALLAWRFPSATPAPIPPVTPASWALRIVASLTLGALFLACVAAATIYSPLDPASLSHTLPRALLQAGEGSIFPLQTTDARQVLLPFNHGLLHVWALAYQPTLPTLNFINLLAWLGAGLAVHRFCRSTGHTPTAALVATWCALTAAPVLAQAANVDHSLLTGAALVAAAGFACRWHDTGRPVAAAFAGLWGGLAAGSSPGALAVVLVVVAVAWVTELRTHRRPTGLVLLFALLPGLLPFLLNLALSVGPNLADLFASLQRTAAGPGALGLGTLLPMLGDTSGLQPPSEDTVGLGPTGLVCLAATVPAFLGLRRRGPGSAWVPLLALSWLALIVFASFWLALDSRHLVPVILLAAPSIATLIDRTGLRRRIWLAISAAVAAGALWGDQHYLWHNAWRPLAPLLDRTLAGPHLARLPALLEHRLSGETRINFSTNADSENLFMLMGRHQNQRFGASGPLQSDAYNIISRSTYARNRPVAQLTQGPAYVMVAFPTKPTAGVEFLGSVGLGPFARDYFGISGQAGQEAPIAANRTLLITLGAEREGKDASRFHFAVMGLNSPDEARLEIVAEDRTGGQHRLATFATDGALSATLPDEPKLHRLVFRILSLANDSELGVAALDQFPPQQFVATLPDEPRRLFGAELVSATDPSPLQTGAGLDAPEGPFPQWNLPLIRWMRLPSVKLTVPASAGLTQLRVSFSARLHIRTRGTLEIHHNGTLVQSLEFKDQTTWQDLTLELPAATTDNVIELRDASLTPGPDWYDYLERYPDVRRHIASVRQDPVEGAREHYELSGRAEGRTVRHVQQALTTGENFYFMFRHFRVEGLRP